MKITTDSIKVGDKTYSATTIDVDEIQIIKEKDVVKKHIIDETLETCDDGMLVEQYKNICDFGSNSNGSEEPKPVLEVSRVLSENSPEVIAAVGNEIAYYGYNSSQVEEKFGWKPGDITSCILTAGENVEVYIIGFNHDDLSDGSGKAGITFQTVNCLSTRYAMNGSKTNYGGYPKTRMNTTTLPSVKANMNQEWQDVIKLVDKKSANGGSSSYKAIITSSVDLFLLSEIEVYGKSSSGQNADMEGVVYEYWKNKSNTYKTKRYDTDADGVVDTKTYWWLRSCCRWDTFNYCAVNNNGADTTYTTTDTLGISFAFCVGAASDYKA